MSIGNTRDTQAAYAVTARAAQPMASAAASGTTGSGALAAQDARQKMAGPLLALQEMHGERRRSMAEPREQPSFSASKSSEVAVVTDGDGTFFDSARLHGEAWLDFNGEHVGASLTLEETLAFHGSDAQIVKWIFNHKLGRDLATDEEELYKEKDVAYQRRLKKEGVEAVAGAPEFFRELGKHMPVALGTNSPAESVDMMLYWTHTHDVFAHKVTGDHVEHKKPAPDIYLEAARLIGLEPKKITAFEDTPPGEIAAVLAGYDHTVIMGNTSSPDDFPEATHNRLFGGSNYFELVRKIGVPEAVLLEHRTPRL